ncbi:hypothetical protein VTK56DRAFT_4446 [Thermocarpiscus australiensis]
MASHLEDVPPPPYSETDVYSASGGRDSHGADDTTLSTASTNGDVIYTPPLTPRSSHQSNFAGEVDSVASSSAAAYFQRRPPPPLPSHPRIVHAVTIGNDSTPDDLPYPSDFASRDVRAEDWQTFINYLMPHHSAASNEQLVDRKLRAEGVAAGSSDDATHSQSSGRSHAEAQMGGIRSPVDEFDAANRRETVEATVREWNDGFFAPRGISVRVALPVLNELPPQQAQSEKHMPGAWDQSFDQQSNNEPAGSTAGPSASTRPRFGLFGFGGGRGRGHGRGGFRFGGINVEGDRVSIGNSFVADGRTGSVRIGGIVADSNGIRINGTPMFGGAGSQHGLRGGGPCGPRSPMGGWGLGGPPGGWPFGGAPGAGWHGRGRGAHSPQAGGPNGWHRHSSPPPFGHQPGEGQDGDAGERRSGRPRSHEGNRSRSSSASSTTSRSSCYTDTSVGSLPDHDDLNDAQLPVAQQHLKELLSHGEQPVTKEKVKRVREQIKEARDVHPPNANGISGSLGIAFDKKALRREVKELLREWKELKRAQKRQRKELRRERKHRRREEKRERRQIKREMKRAAREARRERRHGPFGVPPFPAMPHLPIPGHAPPGPYHPHPPPPPGMDFSSHFNPWSRHQGSSRGAPGAWPTEENGNNNNSLHPNHAASQAKYKAARDVEEQVALKQAELLKLHERIAEEPGASRDGKKGGGRPAKLEVEALAVEKEIEALAGVMEKLRTEADEEYARELAAEETRRAGC